MSINKTRPTTIRFVGGAGCGKGATASYVVAWLKSQHVNCEPVTEYARTFIENCGYPRTIAEQTLIAHRQINAELDKRYCDIIVCDAAPFLAYIYSVHLKPSSKKELPRYHFLLQDIYSLALSTLLEDQEIFYIPPFKRIQMDGVRSWQSEGQILETSHHVLGFLKFHKIPFKIIEGISLEERLASVKAQLNPKIRKIINRKRVR